jgi:asparagine synthase (glutamine-hydrolysing)
MRNELRELILATLLDPRTLQRGYFDPAGVRRLLDEHFSGRRDRSSAIWRLLMFELWHRNFLESICDVKSSLPHALSVPRGEPA